MIIFFLACFLLAGGFASAEATKGLSDRPLETFGVPSHVSWSFRKFFIMCTNFALRVSKNCAQKNTVSAMPTVMLSQPCFCLCFGFSQMTMTLPLRRMILHFSQIGFTDGRTFMCCYLLLKMMPRGRAECTARPDASDAMCLSHSASVIIHQSPPSVKRKILRNRGFRHWFYRNFALVRSCCAK